MESRTYRDGGGFVTVGHKAGVWTVVERCGAGEVRRSFRGTLSEALAFVGRRAAGYACEVTS